MKFYDEVNIYVIILLPDLITCTMLAINVITYWLISCHPILVIYNLRY